MEGQHQQWGCVGDAISRNNRSIIIRLNTRGSMAQGLSKIGGCSACGGSTPCPKMPCQGSEHLWPDTPASIKLSYTISNLFYTKLLGKAAQILFYRNSSASKFYYPIIYALHRWTQIYYQQSELSVIFEAHNLKQQSSESRKIRGEADAISTQRPFSKFEFSHLFLRCWQVLVSPTPGEQNRWHLFSIWTAIFSPTLLMLTNEFYFYRRSQPKT